MGAQGTDTETASKYGSTWSRGRHCMLIVRAGLLSVPLKAFVVRKSVG